MGNRLSDERHQPILQGLPDVLAVLDDSGRIEYVSPSCERLLGRTQSDLTDTRFYDYVHPADRRAVETTLERARDADDAVSTREYRFEHGCGEWTWLEASVGRDDGAKNGRVIVANRPVGGGRDGADHEGDDSVDREPDDLESDDDSVADRLALLNHVIRHDLRNDLDVALTWLEHLDGSGESAMAADRVRSACMHMIELTDNARDYAHLITDSESRTARPIRLVAVLETELERRRELYPDAEFVVDGAIPAVDVPATDLLGSVFRNVLNNAVQHSDREVPEVVLSARETGSSVEIRIADDGPGIDEETKAALRSTDAADIDSAKTGIGLAITTALVEAFGGELEVRDNDPTGTVVVITLPTVEGDGGDADS